MARGALPGHELGELGLVILAAFEFAEAESQGDQVGGAVLGCKRGDGGRIESR
jgi:hypothetical protein